MDNSMKDLNKEEMNKAETGKEEISKEELEEANGGFGLSDVKDFAKAMVMAWDIHKCENNNHDFVWKGELEEETHFNFPYYWRNKILVCSRCGKKKVTNLYEIVGSIKPGEY